MCAHSVCTIQDKCSTVGAVRVCSADYGVSYTKQRRWMLRLKRDVNRTEAEDMNEHVPWNTLQEDHCLLAGPQIVL